MRIAAPCLAVLSIGLALTAPTYSADVLMVGANADPSFGDDGAVYEFLQDLGHNVQYLAGSASTTADGAAADLIIISSTLGSGDARGKFLNLEKPILNWEEALMDGVTSAGNFAMGQGSENGTANPGTQIEILDPAHPLAAGLSGVIEFATTAIPRPYVSGALGPGVHAVAGFPVTAPQIDLSPSGTGMHVGTNQGGGSPFTGLLDDVAVWNRSLSFAVDGARNLTGGELHTVFTQGVEALGGDPPLAHYPFDDQSNAFAVADESGNGNDGVLAGGAFYSSDDPRGGGGSLYLDGTGTFDVPNIERPGGELTYAFWFNPFSDAYGPTFDTADPRVDFFYGNGGGGGTVRPHLSANRNGRPIGLYVNADGDIATPLEATTASFATDTWQHVAITWDGDVGSVFINGHLENQISLARPAEWSITYVDEGGELTDGTFAPGKRVNFPIQDTGFASLTGEGLGLFAAAVEWLLSEDVPLGCDFNGSGTCDISDLDLLLDNLGTDDPTYNLDSSDNTVTLSDRDVWLSLAGQQNGGEDYFTGDTDLNGVVDAGDLNRLGVSWLSTNNPGWQNGDFNGDDIVNASDLNALGTNWQRGVGAASAVPEPTSWSMLLLFSASLLLRRRVAW